jgi:hypothetical protein
MTTTISDPTEAPARPSPEQTGNSGELTGVTPELRALLMGYTDALDSVHKAPMFFCLNPENPLLSRWLVFPVLRYFVSAIFVRYLYRCADALKSAVMRRGVMSGTGDEHNGDLKLLEQFGESLPRKLRLGFNLPLGLMVVLSVAYLLAWWRHAAYQNLIGDLVTAVISVDRAGAIAAFNNANRLAGLGLPLEANFFAGAATVVTWSSIVAIVPLLPALYVVRRTRSQLADVEGRAFDTLGARPVHEIQLDLITRSLLMVAFALLGAASVAQAVTKFHPNNLEYAGSIVIGALSVAMTILAGIELSACYRERLSSTADCRNLATKISFATIVVLSIGLFFSLPYWEQKSTLQSNFWPRNVSTNPPKPDDSDHARGWLTDQLSFMVTQIKQNAQCLEPHGFLIDNQQYLQFDIEVWSDVDQFVNRAAAYGLALPHWSVRDSSGKSTGSLYMHPQCGHGTEAISKPISPGAHSITSVVVSAPRDAVCLQLDVPSYRGKWAWPIPPVKEECSSG